MLTYIISFYLLVGIGFAICPAGRKHIWEAGRNLRPSANPFAPPRTHPRWKLVALYAIVCGSLVIFWPMIAPDMIKKARENTPESIREFGRKHRAEEVPQAWLTNRISVGDVKAKFVRSDKLLDDRASLPKEPTERDLRESDNLIAKSMQAKWVRVFRAYGVPFENFQGPDPARNRVNLALGYAAWVAVARLARARDMNLVWKEMIDSMQDGDELWEYCSPDHYWEHLAGRAGIALVRQGEIVDATTTMMN